VKRDHDSTRSLTLRVASIDEEQRSVEAVLATETPVTVQDGALDEVLMMAGAELPRQLAVLDDHARSGIESVIGSARNMRIEGDKLTGRLFVAEGPPDSLEERTWRKIRDGHLMDVSIAYRSAEFVEIPAGETRNVGGRTFTAGNRTLRIATRWQPGEVSLTPIGADESAKIRSASPRSESTTMPKSRVPAGRRRALMEEFRAAAWLGCRMSAVDARAAHAEQLRQALAAENLQGRSAMAVLTEFAEATIGHVPENKPDLIRSVVEGNAAIFTDHIGASITRGYAEALGSTLGWTSRDILDRSFVQRVRLQQPPNLHLIPRGGGAPMSDLHDRGAVREEYRIATFGERVTIDEQDLVDDLLDVTTLIPQQYGQAAARLVVDLAFSELLTNRTMHDGETLFSAAHENDFAGALDGTKLDEATEKLLAQSDGGVPLDLAAKYLLVPPALAGTARKLACERRLDDDGDLVVISTNRLTGVRDPVTGETVAGSPTTWYLTSADGAIELAFLMRDTPLIGTGPFDASDGVYGIWYDVRMRVAARPVRPRSIVRYSAA
jgi:hypothetical protein